MAVYTVQDPKSGKIIDFEWLGSTPPNDHDIQEVFNAAKDAPEPGFEQPKEKGFLERLASLAKQGAIGMGEGVVGTAMFPAEVLNAAATRGAEMIPAGIRKPSPLPESPTQTIEGALQGLLGKPAEPEGLTENIARTGGQFFGGGGLFGALTKGVKGMTQGATAIEKLKSALSGAGGLENVGATAGSVAADEMGMDNPIAKLLAAMVGSGAVSLGKGAMAVRGQGRTVKEEAGDIVRKLNTPEDVAHRKSELAKSQGIDDAEAAHKFVGKLQGEEALARDKTNIATEKQIRGLKSKQTGTELGAETRDWAQALKKDAKESVGKLYKEVDPENKITLRADPLVEKVGEFERVKNIFAEPGLKKLKDVFEHGGTIKINQLNEFESGLFSAQAKTKNAISSPTRNQDLADIKGLLDAVKEIRKAAPKDAIERTNLARTAYRENVIETFEQGAMGGVLDKSPGAPQIGGWKKPDAKVMDTFFKHGEEGRANMAQYKKAGMSQEAMTNHIAEGASKYAVTKDGAVDLKAFDGYLKKYEPALSEAPGALQRLKETRSKLAAIADEQSKIPSVPAYVPPDISKTGESGLKKNIPRLASEGASISSGKQTGIYAVASEAIRALASSPGISNKEVRLMLRQAMTDKAFAKDLVSSAKGTPERWKSFLAEAKKGVGKAAVAGVVSTRNEKNRTFFDDLVK